MSGKKCQLHPVLECFLGQPSDEHWNPWWLAGFLLLAVPCGGCAAARPYTLLKYDAKTDTFHELRIYVDIRDGSDNRDQTAGANGLSALWRERDRGIPNILCFYEKASAGTDAAPTSFDFALKRIGEQKYELLYRQQPDPFSMSSAWLDRAAIKPGKLFLSPQKTLCYYHEVSLPGRAWDEALREGDTDVRRALAARVEQELARRRNGGGREPWDDFQKKMVVRWDELAKNEFRIDGGPEPDPLFCLDESSLKLLQAATKAKQPLIVRKAGEIRSSYPLSAEDCRRAKAVFDAVKERVLKPELSKKPVEGEPPKQNWELAISLAAVATMLQATIEKDKRFVMTLRVPSFIDLTTESIRGDKPTPKKTADYQKAIAVMKAAGASIDAKLTINDVLREFKGKSP
jgi:hypothetical protein